jgi:predicted transcriptional regulator of viral defense system
MEAALWPQVRRPDARGVISHESALAIYGLSDANPTKVHLTLPTAFRVRRAVPKRLLLHYANLTAKDVQQVDGVPVTTAARAIRDAHASHLGRALIRQARNLFEVIGHLHRVEGLHFELSLKAVS